MTDAVYRDERVGVNKGNDFVFRFVDADSHGFTLAEVFGERNDFYMFCAVGIAGAVHFRESAVGRAVVDDDALDDALVFACHGSGNSFENSSLFVFAGDDDGYVRVFARGVYSGVVILMEVCVWQARDQEERRDQSVDSPERRHEGHVCDEDYFVQDQSGQKGQERKIMMNDSFTMLKTRSQPVKFSVFLSMYAFINIIGRCLCMICLPRRIYPLADNYDRR